MSALMESVQADSAPASTLPTAEEENGTLTLSGDWPVRIDENYDDFVRFFGYNPEHWVVLDPGKMSKWQQSKRTESGDRDLVWLYSYRGVKFRKKTADDLFTEEQLHQATERAQTWRPPIRRTLGKGLGEPETYVFAQGDQQAGKAEGLGLEGLQEREERALENSLAYIERLMKFGVNIEAIADVQTGDRIENIFGHYNAQMRTTDTLRAQYGYATDSEVMRIKALAEFGLPILLPRTPSNHGEIRPATGVAPMTSASDNFDLTIAETVQRVLKETPIDSQLTWLIPHDEYLTTFEISGVKCGVTHGHKIRGAGTKAIADWTRNQRDYLAFHEDYKMRLLIMGHFHHYYAEDVSGTTVIMTPAMDGGSPWFQASSGNKSVPGLLGMTVAPHHPLGFANLSPL